MIIANRLCEVARNVCKFDELCFGKGVCLFFPDVGVHVTVKSISSGAQKYQGIGCFPH